MYLILVKKKVLKQNLNDFHWHTSSLAAMPAYEPLGPEQHTSSLALTGTSFNARSLRGLTSLKSYLAVRTNKSKATTAGDDATRESIVKRINSLQVLMVPIP